MIEEVANEVLQSLDGLFAADDAFDNAFVTPGPPAWDCQQITLHMGNLRHSGPFTEGQGRPLKAGHPAVPTVDFIITTLRCIAVQDDSGRSPDPDVIAADGARLLRDADILWYGTLGLITTDSLVTSVFCPTMTMVGLVPVGPSGGLAGHQLTIRTTL